MLHDPQWHVLNETDSLEGIELREGQARDGPAGPFSVYGDEGLHGCLLTTLSSAPLAHVSRTFVRQ